LHWLKQKGMTSRNSEALTWIFHECDEGQDFGIWFGGSLCFYLFRGYASDFVQTAPLPP